MTKIVFKRQPDYEPTDFVIVADERYVLDEETDDPVEVQLPNGNRIVIGADGAMSYWTQGGTKLQFEGRFVADGLVVGGVQ